MFRMFAFVGVLSLGGLTFAEEKKTEGTPSEESIQVVCPVKTEENCENCDKAAEPEQQPVVNAENK